MTAKQRPALADSQDLHWYYGVKPAARAVSAGCYQTTGSKNKVSCPPLLFSYAILMVIYQCHADRDRKFSNTQTIFDLR